MPAVDSARRRAVVTGLGVVAPGAIGSGPYWDLISSGATATRTMTLFDPAGFRCQVGAECDFDAKAAGLSPQEIRRNDRAGQFAMVAAREALADSGLDLDTLDPRRTGTTMGSAVGNTMTMESEYVAVSNGGRDWLVDWRYAATFGSPFVPSSVAAEVAWLARAEGPVSLVSTGCTSGLDAIGHAGQLIEDGSADVMLVGAADAPLSPITIACFDALKATTTRNDDPAHACRPFDRSRDGIVLGEGAAVFVVEEAEHARRRGATARVDVAGYANRANAHHMTGLKPDGRELAEAIRCALDAARVDATDVDYVNAHGSGTTQNDRHETAAVKVSLGRHAWSVPISSIKSMIGHSLGAIGALEIAACVLAMEQRAVPPTANLHEPDPECDLDYVPLTARDVDVDVALSVGSGFGGFQTAVVLTRSGAVT